MKRLLVALGTLLFGFLLISAIAAEGNATQALALGVVSVAAFFGILAHPTITYTAIAAVVGVILTLNGGPMEGVGLIGIAGLVAYRLYQQDRFAAQAEITGTR
ncbi:MAG: hypothetical protein OEX04_16455 [Acidimicrobiia bacterium]|nr:hypothetical protein [Acidimicrobiia bacterium]MDH4309060.1 hypothetical protein [Acidimicrobiia bacterium]MDH5293923.1 hypothetical protein [Acidimicrobiia bacterium]